MEEERLAIENQLAGKIARGDEEDKLGRPLALWR